MTTVYEEIGLRRVVNASGRMTYLGVSTISDAVAKAAVSGAQNYVIIAELMDKAGEIVAHYTGAEDACVTCSASAAIAISAAALVSQGKKSIISRLPDSTGLKNEIILQKGHSVNYGGPIPTMLKLGGAVPVEVGSSNKVDKEEMSGAINDKTIALMYVKSHHCVQKGMVSLEDMIAIAHAHNLPLLIDAAAEEDLKKYVALGCDLVVYSGAKAIEATTSGFVTGKKEYITWCKKQYEGIGRAMKVGKEGIVGLLEALKYYDSKDRHKEAEENLARVEKLNEALNQIPHCKATVRRDEAGREIYRSQVVFDETCKLTATEVSDKLISGNPSIHCRPNLLNTGIMMFDPRPMVPGDDELIVKRMKEIMEEEK